MLKKVLVPSHSSTERDDAAQCIRTVFPTIEAMEIPHPYGLTADNPEPHKKKFNEAISSTIMHILSHIKVKTIYNSAAELKGPNLATLLENYVSVINSAEFSNLSLNLRASYFVVAKNSIQSAIKQLQKEYHDYMEGEMEGKPPVEQGDIESLKQFHTGIVENVLLQNKCEFLETTLFAIHKQKYFKLAQKLGSELLMWALPVVSEDSVDFEKRKRYMIEFQNYIIELEGNNIKGGHLQIFLIRNERRSKEMCERLVKDIYYAQTCTTGVSLEQLKQDYYKKAVGPTKDEVFYTFSSNIPGPPHHVKLLSATDTTLTIQWEAPITNPQATLFYEVKFYQEGKDANQTNAIQLYKTKTLQLNHLHPKTKYAVKICGSNTDYAGEFCKPVMFQTKTGKPDKPEKLSIAPTSDTQGELTVELLPISKQNGSPVTNIIVFRRIGGPHEWKKVLNAPIKGEQEGQITLKVDITCTKEEKRLYFLVQFKNEAGLSEPSKVELDIKDILPGVPEIVELICKLREIHLKWSKPSNSWAIKSYCIQYRKTEEDTAWSNKNEDSKKQATTISKLYPKTKYSICLCAANTRGKYIAFCSKEAETAADRPNKPQIVGSIDVVSAAKGTISILKPTPIEENGSKVTNAVLERYTQPGHDAKWEKDTEILITSTLDESVTISIEFDIINITEKNVLWYRVRTRNEVGLSEPSKSVKLNMKDIIPGVPKITRLDRRPREIRVMFSQPTNFWAVETYCIEYTTIGIHNTQTKWETVTMHRDHIKGFVIRHLEELTLGELSPRTRYLIHIYARNAKGIHDGYCSKEIETPADRPNKPQIIGSVKVISATKGVINILKPTPGEENGSRVCYFLLERKIGRNWEKDKTVEATFWEEPSDTIPIEVDLLNYTEEVASLEVLYRVQMHNEAGSSAPSTTIKLFPDQIIPAKPENLKATKVTGNSIAISWQKPNINPGLVEVYYLYFGKKGKPNWHINATTTLAAEIENLQPRTVYQFTVEAYNGKIASKKSDVLLVETLPTAPPKPITPMVIPQGKRFLLKFYLPAISESGSRVEHILVYHFDQNGEKYGDPTQLEISSSARQSFNEKSKYELTIEINTSKTFWITIALKNIVGESEESEISGVYSKDVTPGNPYNVGKKLMS